MQYDSVVEMCQMLRLQSSRYVNMLFAKMYYKTYGISKLQKYGNQFYGRAQNLNMQLTKAYDTALTKYDVIIMPTLTFTAPLLPKENASYEGI